MNTTVQPSRLITDKMESMGRHAGGVTALRGVLAVVLGIIAIHRPDVAATAFVVVFAVYAFADGLLDFVLAGQLGRAGLNWGWYLFEGLASLALGVIALVYPGLTLVALVLLVGLRALTLGIFEMVAAFSWRELASRWLLGLTGALSIVLGVMLLASPVAGGAALIWTIGVYGIVFGVALFALGLHMLSAVKREAELHGGPPVSPRPA